MMELTSSAFVDGGTIPVHFTCDGEDKRPPLSWSSPPPGTRSFVLIVDDPDAPRGVWRHWGVYDIPVTQREVGAGDSAPGGTSREARNDFGTIGYGGPCPPRSDKPHRYRFRVLALDVPRLTLRPTPRVAEVELAAEPHVLGEARLTVRYQRR